MSEEEIAKVEIPEQDKVHDPITDLWFSAKYTSEQIDTVMEARFGIDKELEKTSVEQAKIIMEAQKTIDTANDKILEKQKALDKFDDDYLPIIRAPALADNLAYNRKSTFTTYYAITCRVAKAKKPYYDSKDPAIVEWARTHCPDAVKKQEVLKTKINAVLKGLSKDEIPDCVEMKLPNPRFEITRLK